MPVLCVQISYSLQFLWEWRGEAVPTAPQKPKNQTAILSALITSKTRLKLLLKLFSHPDASGHLRGFAEEFGDSTNSVRIELGKLQQAGLIESFADGQKVIYRPNAKNPFYLELTKLVSKYLGFDQLVERMLSQLGDLQAAYVIGDYANGLDSGVIELALVGDINQAFAVSLAKKGEQELGRKVRLAFLEDEVSLENVSKLKLLWQPGCKHIAR